MGRHYVNKCLLLDEQEVGMPLFNDFGLCERSVRAKCDGDFGPLTEEELRGFDSYPYPDYELLGIASERFDRTVIYGDNYARPRFLRHGDAWWPNLARIFKGLGRLSDEDLSVLKSDGPSFEAKIRSQIIQQVAEDNFAGAQRLCDVLAGLRWTDLPCFRHASNMSTTGDDDAIDYRSEDFGTGTRVLAEIAFVWE